MICPQKVEMCMASGDDLRIIIEVYDQNNDLVDISSASSITWALAQDVGSVAIITKSLGSGIVINTPTSFYFDLTDTETSPLVGTYFHEAEIITSSGKKYTALQGRFTLKQTLI